MNRKKTLLLLSLFMLAAASLSLTSFLNSFNQNRQGSFSSISAAGALPGAEENWPELIGGAVEPKIEANSAIVVFYQPETSRQKVLFTKDSDRKLPIASVSKLMAALIVLENYDNGKIIEISEKAASQNNGSGQLKAGESFQAIDLLYALLLESSNSAAYGLAEEMGLDQFVLRMNGQAEKLNMKNTYFINPSGLDPDDPEDKFNYSTAGDLVLLTKELLKKPLLWQILSRSEYKLRSSGGNFHHQLINTNEFLSKRQVSWQKDVLGGKTGWTPLSAGCLVLALQAPAESGYLITAVLSSPDRFKETEDLINWALESHKWNQASE